MLLAPSKLIPVCVPLLRSLLHRAQTGAITQCPVSSPYRAHTCKSPFELGSAQLGSAQFSQARLAQLFSHSSAQLAQLSLARSAQLGSARIAQLSSAQLAQLSLARLAQLSSAQPSSAQLGSARSAQLGSARKAQLSSAQPSSAQLCLCRGGPRRSESSTSPNGFEARSTVPQPTAQPRAVTMGLACPLLVAEQAAAADSGSTVSFHRP
jgi:hypothetical protein